MDSVQQWQVPFDNRFVTGDGVNLLAISYLSDSSIVGVGVQAQSPRYDGNFYLARITGVGVPYNPANPLSTHHTPLYTQITPYPNPCASTLRFAGQSQQANLVLYGMEGKLHIQKQVQPKQAVDVSMLPKGLYLYRLTSQGTAWSGRVVKE